MNLEEKLELVKRGTEEIVTEEELREILKKKAPVGYWGTATTGEVHTGYLIPVQKIMDFVEAGFKFKILIADVHSYLDDMKTPWELMKARAEYYRACFEALGLRDVEYVFDSDFKYDKEYVEKVYRLSVLVTQKRALRAASEVCRLKNPKVSELLYPIMQSVDCWWLGVDVAYSGTDQRHIYMLSREILPKIGLEKPTLVMTPMLSGLVKGVKSSASIPESNIKIYDEPEVIKKKIISAWCPPEPKGNPILEYYKFIIFPRFGKIRVERPEKFGGDVEFENYEELEKAYVSKSIHPLDLKTDLIERLTKILEPCRKYFENKKELIENAYPVEENA